jgi:fructose-bisphosphate aldolase class I
VNLEQLESVAQAMVQPGKGILAADESSGTIQRRLEGVGAESTEENRIAWRSLICTAEGLGEYISGVILFDETLRQDTNDGRRMVEALQAQGIIPGIKVDTGAKDLPGSPDEKVTEGLDGLRERLAEYVALGAQFTKWRAVITIGADIPTSNCINVNAHGLARYAALSQEAGLVPIVEPEVLMDGDHDIDRCFEVTEAALRQVFIELASQGVALSGMVLKPNMVLSGKEAVNRASPEVVAEKTITCFQRAFPAAVPGAAFLSGGQSDDEATTNLDAINRSNLDKPWQLSFSYGRGLQALPLAAWGGDPANVGAAQAALLHRARMTATARQGAYSPEMEKELATA